MTLQNFIMTSKTAKDKVEFVKKHITTTYVPYQEKIAECKKIVDFTTENVNTKMFEQNTPFRYMFFILSLIDLYTDIDVDYQEPLLFFNTIEKERFTDLIVASIPEREYDMMQTVLSMCVDDYMENYRSLTGFLETKFKSFGLGVETLSNGLNELMNNPEMLEKLRELQQ